LALLVVVVAAVSLLLFNPPLYIALESNLGPENGLREGRVFTFFLAKHNNWTVMTSADSLVVDTVDDLPASFGAPKFYRLSEAGLKTQCPPETALPDGGGIDFALRLFKNSNRIAVNGGSNAGANAVGCQNYSVIDKETFFKIPKESLDISQYSLYFDTDVASSMKSSSDKARLDTQATIITSFFSNLTERKLTSSMHSAAIPSSMVVVCSGVKTWFFLKPDCCNEYAHQIYNAATIGRGFPPTAEITAIQMRRGDILTFGQYQHHIVVTAPGPSFMQTYRIVSPANIWPIIHNFGWSGVRSIVDARINNPSRKAAVQAQPYTMLRYCHNDIDPEAWKLLQDRIDTTFPNNI
jgi:hypothetical protein